MNFNTDLHSALNVKEMTPEERALMTMAECYYTEFRELLSSANVDGMCDRDKVDEIRERMIADERLIDCCEYVLGLAGNANEFVHSIIRVEAKRAMRRCFAERIERQRLKDLAKAEEARLLREEMESNPTFGMF